VYNDVAIAIARSTRDHPGLRIAYVDIDAHHGDGVEAAFVERGDVLTLSVHESGRYLFPGTGRTSDVGSGDGFGYAVNLPLPPYADPQCYQLAHELVIAPALRAFAPDVIVAQIGGDTHRADPLTHLYQSVQGFVDAVSGLIACAEELTEGRIVFTGGGGYRHFSEVPRMWAAAMAVALGRDVPARLPAEWLDRANRAAREVDEEGPRSDATMAEHLPELSDEARAAALQVTRLGIDQLRELSPLLRAGS
jgi:acetoin utilization protein AcuC